MLRLVSLADNERLEVKAKDLQRARLAGIWLGFVDPTPKELRKVAEVSGIRLDFQLLPSLWLWRRKWLRTMLEALEKHGA